MYKLFQTIRRWYKVHILKVGGITRTHGGIALDTDAAPVVTGPRFWDDNDRPDPDIKLVRN